MNEILRLSNVSRIYRSGSDMLAVLTGVELTICRGEIVSLVAPSGSGKSTLLHLAGLLEKPDGGSIVINGANAGLLPDRDRTAIRLRTIGVVYQSHHLLTEFTALENVVLPQMINGKSETNAKKRGMMLLEMLELTPCANQFPGKLSGGEQQRVAIARALANHPSLLLADEPTGNLDGARAEIVLAELLRLVRSEQVAALIATHNPEVAQRTDRTLTLRDGKLF